MFFSKVLHASQTENFIPAEFSRNLTINEVSRKLARFGSFFSGFGSLKMR